MGANLELARPDPLIENANLLARLRNERLEAIGSCSAVDELWQRPQQLVR